MFEYRFKVWFERHCRMNGLDVALVLPSKPELTVDQLKEKAKEEAVSVLRVRRQSIAAATIVGRSCVR